VRFFVVALLGIAACPSNGAPKTPWEFYDRYCEYFGRCCSEAGLPDGVEHCKEASSILNVPFRYSAKTGEACLDALEAGRLSAELCTNPVEAVFECLATTIDTRPIGADCEVFTECAVPAEGIVDCAGSYFDGSGVCQQVVTGREGDSPCLIYDGLDALTSPAYQCERSEGLFCNPIGRACTRLAEPEEPCWDESMCVDGSYCDFASALCATSLEPGSACDPSTRYQCKVDAVCDYSSKQCVALLPVGAPCTYLEDHCASSSCLDGRCRPPPDFDESYFSLLCGANE
jgi:hypothetical protein